MRFREIPWKNRFKRAATALYCLKSIAQLHLAGKHATTIRPEATQECMPSIKSCRHRAFNMVLSKIKFTIGILAFGISGISNADNQQTVNAKGSIINSAATRGTAVMNMASTKGISVPSSNQQVVEVHGPVVNSAAFGGYAELNMASKTARGSSGNQNISIGGPVINQAYGDQKTITNIGSSR